MRTIYRMMRDEANSILIEEIIKFTCCYKYVLYVGHKIISLGCRSQVVRSFPTQESGESDDRIISTVGHDEHSVPL